MRVNVVSRLSIELFFLVSIESRQHVEITSHFNYNIFQLLSGRSLYSLANIMRIYFMF